MSIFKCKMCGGTLEVNNNETVGVCEYCGTKQTLPKLDNERKSNLYDRANHFRRNDEFDKAMSIYEQILNEDRTDAESYWSIVLCRYGIEYVEDPTTHKRIPTVNRTQLTSIFDDEDYKSALQYADGYQREIYENEANIINEIQKGILAISQKEDPFDVFICYKETDKSGRRTQDSVLAQELYYELVEEGFKVFFAKITLEEKLGQEYEPYIFAALNSAKVMVVLGTTPEHFNAVWVKNEWSRFLALIKKGEDKMLIPAYRDMDPYDLPEEFSHLQAQDMAKLGFMQDLVRGISKIVFAKEPISKEKEKVVAQREFNIEALLKRVFMFLEDGDWSSADEYCEKVLDFEPENARAYLGKLMVELKVKQQEKLRECEEPFDSKNNYRKIIRFGDEKLVQILKEDLEYITKRNEIARMKDLYDKGVSAMTTASTEEDYRAIVDIFRLIPEYEDSNILMAECFKKAESERVSREREEEAARLEMERKKEEERIAKEKRNKKIKRFMFIFVPIMVALSTLVLAINCIVIPLNKYKEAQEYVNNGDYDKAYQIYDSLGDYKDATNKKDKIQEKATREVLIQVFSKAEIGESVKLGFYEQDNVINNGKESVEWIVLDKQDNKILVISKYGLNCKEYHDKKISVGNEYKMYHTTEAATWETSSIREWLNTTFINDVFNSVQQKFIMSTTIDNPENPQYSSISGGNDCIDKMFLLSIDEVEKHMESNEKRVTQATSYSVERGSKNSIDSGNCKWWLRTLGQSGVHAAYVNNDGTIFYAGSNVDYSHITIRPAMWVDIETE